MSNSYSIVYLANQQNLGDKANAEAIAANIKSGLDETKNKVEVEQLKLVRKENSAIEEIDEADLEKLTSNTKQQIIVVGSGLHAIEPLAEIKIKNPKIKTFWSGHMFYDGLQDNIKHIDGIFVPSHIEISKSLQLAYGSKIFRQFGVPFVFNQKVEQENKDKAQDIINKAKENNKKIVVIQLGGDVVDLDGKSCTFYLKAEEVEKFGEFLIEKYQDQLSNTQFIISNNNRTGKYNPEKPNEVLNKHDDENSKDHVTNALLKVLDKAHANHSSYNFISGKPNGIGLGMKLAELDHEVDYYVGAESISLGSELAIRPIVSSQIYFWQPEYLHPGYQDNKPSESKQKITKEYSNFIDQLYDKNVGNILEYDGKGYQIKKVRGEKDKGLILPSKKVANKIIEKCKDKNLVL